MASDHENRKRSSRRAALHYSFPIRQVCSHHCQIFFERIGTHQGSFLALLAVILYLAQSYQRKIPELGKEVGERGVGVPSSGKILLCPIFGSPISYRKGSLSIFVHRYLYLFDSYEDESH